MMNGHLVGCDQVTAACTVGLADSSMSSLIWQPPPGIIMISLVEQEI
jgi:hypothetical protein